MRFATLRIALRVLRPALRVRLLQVLGFHHERIITLRDTQSVEVWERDAAQLSSTHKSCGGCVSVEGGWGLGLILLL